METSIKYEQLLHDIKRIPVSCCTVTLAPPPPSFIRLATSIYFTANNM